MSARNRLALDAGLFVALLVAYYPVRTGIAVHEWLSIAIVVPLLAHLIINWDWTTAVAARLAGKLRATSKVNFAVDVLLFVSAVAVVLSGLLVSQSIAGLLGLQTNASLIWHSLHSVAADATIVLMLAHLGLHWRWIARTLGLNDARPRMGATRAMDVQPLSIRPSTATYDPARHGGSMAVAGASPDLDWEARRG